MSSEPERRPTAEMRPKIDHFRNPQNYGPLENADGFARITGPCGDTITIWLKISGDIIRDVGFTTNGCRHSLACGSTATALSKGKSIAEALSIGQKEVINALPGLPEENHHCALLATNVLKAAIRDYIQSCKQPSTGVSEHWHQFRR